MVVDTVGLMGMLTLDARRRTLAVWLIAAARTARARRGGWMGTVAVPPPIMVAVLR
jgi:hypothetical protein